jgi:hypothetical protein
MGFEPTVWHVLKQKVQHCNGYQVPLELYEGRSDVLHIRLSATAGGRMRGALIETSFTVPRLWVWQLTCGMREHRGNRDIMGHFSVTHEPSCYSINLPGLDNIGYT